MGLRHASHHNGNRIVRNKLFSRPFHVYFFQEDGKEVKKKMKTLFRWQEKSLFQCIREEDEQQSRRKEEDEGDARQKTQDPSSWTENEEEVRS